MKRAFFLLGVFIYGLNGGAQAIEPFSIGATDMVINWTTETEADPALFFGDTYNPSQSYYSQMPSAPTQYHNIVMKDLIPETTYYYFAEGFSDINVYQTRPVPNGRYIGRIAILTDSHINTKDYNSQERYLSAADILTTALNKAYEDQCELAIITGDLTDSGSEAEWNILISILTQSPIPVCPLVGNHDKGNDPVWLDKFSELITQLSDKGLLPCQYEYQNDPGRYLPSGVHLFKNQWLFILLDSMIPQGGGKLDRNAFYYLLIKLLQYPGLNTMLFFHHAYLRHYLAYIHEALAFQIENTEELTDFLLNYPQVKFVFSGHAHLNWKAEKNQVYNIINSALIGYPIAYHLVDIFESGILKTARRIPEFLSEDAASLDQMDEYIARRLGDLSIGLSEDVYQLVINALYGTLEDRSFVINVAEATGPDTDAGDVSDSGAEDAGESEPAEDMDGASSADGGIPASEDSGDGPQSETSAETGSGGCSQPGPSNGSIPWVFLILLLFFLLRQALTRSWPC